MICAMEADRLQLIIKHIDADSLTDWETDFLISIERYFERNGDLTEKQEEILERIWREKH